MRRAATVIAGRNLFERVNTLPRVEGNAYFGGQPWDDASLYRARSPVFQAKGVTTPTLVQHGEADVRVPISQGYEFYNAVKQQGTPVEMLVLPRQPHGPTEPRMILKIMQTNLDWFEKHLKPGS